MIVMRHRPPAAKRTSRQVLGLVGKAVTFDTGGISIKPSAGMEEMKMDMAGGAAVIAAMGLIADLEVPVEVVAVVPVVSTGAVVSVAGTVAVVSTAVPTAGRVTPPPSPRANHC